MAARALWDCPECPEKLTAEADRPEQVRAMMVELVRMHLDLHHATQPNPVAQALSASLGHTVQLWGGPFDGGTLQLVQDQLPDVLGVATGDSGELHPIHQSILRLRPDVETYRRPPGEQGGRYVHQPRVAA